MGILPFLGTGQATAEDLVIDLMKSNAPNIELVQDAAFDVGYGNIGNTSANTIIGLGQVDFGADGNAYQAAGVEFAQGWGSYDEAKRIVLSAGATPEEAVPFNEITATRTYGYHQFDMFAENMKTGEGFTRPTGVQNVWLTFSEGNGNLRSVKFYEEAFAEGEEGKQPWVNEMEGYDQLATAVDGSQFVRSGEIPENPEEDPYKDAKYDTNTGCWGGTNDGLILESTEEIDFGNGDYKQLVAYIGHDGERYTEYMEFYIDEVKPENMIARTWTGINIQEWNKFTPVATALEQVTGSHRLFIKWGNATNLQKIELVKESLWFENPDCGVVYDNEQPSEQAVLYVTTGESGAASGVDTTCHHRRIGSRFGRRHHDRSRMGNHQARQRRRTLRRQQHRVHQGRSGRGMARHRLQGRRLQTGIHQRLLRQDVHRQHGGRSQLLALYRPGRHRLGHCDQRRRTGSRP